MTQNRLKSWAAWSSVLGQVVAILAATGVLEKIGLTSELANQIIAVVGEALTLFGVFNNPTDKENF